MRDTAFKLYMLFIISWFTHLPTRVPFLGAIRFDLILIALITIFVLGGSKDKYEGDRGLDRVLALLFLYILITVPFVAWPGSVIKAGIPDFIKALVFYFFTVSLVDTEKKLKVFLLIFIVVQTFRVLEPLYMNAAYGYWGGSTHLGGGATMERLAGSPYDIINPNGLAYVITSVIPFLHYLSLRRSIGLKAVYIAGLPLLVYALVLTASRSGFLALGVIVAGIFVKSRHKVVLAVILVLAGSLAIANMDDEHMERYLSITESDVRGSETASTRIEGVKDNFRISMERPILGHGLGTSLEAMANIAGKGLKAHNLYAEILIEIGIAGLLLFLFYAWTLFSRLRSLSRDMKRRVDRDDFFVGLTSALQVWFLMNILFSFASYGLSSYEWYLFGGLIVVTKRLATENGKGLAEAC